MCSDDLDPTNVLENSLIAKEKIISDLNMELHKMETTFSNEREQYMNEIKKLNTLLDEKVCITFFSIVISVHLVRSMSWQYELAYDRPP